MRVFIETTIPSYLTARPARDVLQFARQEVTREWWETRRHLHELFTSQLVLHEAAKGDPDMARLRLECLSELQLLDINDRVLALAQRFLAERLIPVEEEDDAIHLATATVHGMDILLSLNYRHIVNAALQSRLRRIAEDAGYGLPFVCTPDQVMEEPS
jgi:hypothetical protein